MLHANVVCQAKLLHEVFGHLREYLGVYSSAESMELPERKTSSEGLGR